MVNIQDTDNRKKVDLSLYFKTPLEGTFEHKKLLELQKYFWDVERYRWDPKDPTTIEFLYDYMITGEMIERIATFCGTEGNKFSITVWKEHILLKWRVK